MAYGVTAQRRAAYQRESWHQYQQWRHNGGSSGGSGAAYQQRGRQA